MKKMNRMIGAMLIAALTMGLTACGGGGEASGKAETGAGDGANGDVSGKVVIYTSMYEDIIDDMDAQLDEVFPNLDIEFFQGGSGTIQSKVAAEMESGKLGCDILMVAEPSYSLELKEAGILHSHDFADKDKLVFDYDPDGCWYPVRVCNMVLAYNPEKHDKSELPQSLKDFAEDSSVKGKISMSNPLTSGTAFSSVVGLLDKYGEDYFKALGKQDVAIESGSVALTKLETGECSEIMVLEESVLKKREEESSALEVIYPEDGSIPVPSPIMIIDEKHSANSNIAAAEAVEDYFLSPEGQKMIVNGWMYGVRKDVEDKPYDGLQLSDMLKNTISVDWEKCYRERDSIRTMFEEYVTVPES
ncbi:MAG: ABC transporter substrate-binding protein [Lachnospiraceae bacterium]|nr:ABC transporter substrate-binding protein [Lachnospiraceae bacterium]